VAEVVASGVLVGGSQLERFETELARTLERRGAVCVASGSAALHLALLALDLPPDSAVAFPSYTCVSLLQAIRRAGLRPLPVDCDPETFQLDPEDLLRRRDGAVRALIRVHTFGLPAFLDPAASRGLETVDDVATAIGARVGSRPAGREGRLAICSFHATKMITTGAGGVVAADDDGLLRRVLDLVSYDARDDPTVRFNERLAELPSALGRSQLARLGELLEARRRIARIYREELEGSGLRFPRIAEDAVPSWHRFVVRVPRGATAVRRHLAGAGVASPKPVHAPAHRILGLPGYPGAETLQAESLSLPIYPALEPGDARTIATEVRRCLAAR
jgi:dTDP-4-amino-4,6-dideoxygalactose transaminase